MNAGRLYDRVHSDPMERTSGLILYYGSARATKYGRGRHIATALRSNILVRADDDLFD